MLSLTPFPQNITSWGIEAVLEAACTENNMGNKFSLKRQQTTAK